MCALSVATADALSKKALATDNDTYLVAWVRIGYAVPFLIFILPFIDIPELDNVFFIVTFVLIPLEITALILYMKAISLVSFLSRPQIPLCKLLLIIL